MNKKILLGSIAVAILAVLGYFAYRAMLSSSVAQKVNPRQIIGLSLGTLKEERWQKDKDFFVKRAEELGAKVNVLSADTDKNLQVSQIESLILQNVSVLVIVPEDGKLIAPLVEKAHQKGIKVIAYDRLIPDSDLDAYITFDYIKAGEQQAEAVLRAAGRGNFAVVEGAETDSTVAMQREGIMNMLQPEVKKGNVNIVYENFTDDWKPEVAYQNIKKLLSTNVKLDGVVAMNDGTAYGTIRALEEYGLSGKVPVSGMDAELGGCQRIVGGTQTQTSYLPIYLQAYKAAEVAVAFAKGEKVTFSGATNNNRVEVPTYLVQPISVTKDNMLETVIKDGFHTYEEVYQSIPLDKRPPRK
jgi:D-xylose transport system substrate-binding protein